MTWLQCVGGPADGRTVEVIGKSLAVSSVPPQKPMLDCEMREGVSYTVTNYTRRTIDLQDNGKGSFASLFEYLAPEGWSDRKALAFQFTKRDR